ncbi:MAG: amidophosphoribosyltransferase [Candidatus Saccharimonadales bacterium]
MSEGLHEKCAVTALVGFDPETSVTEATYESLFAMQHRGTEATGIASILPDGRLETVHGKGLVRDVFTPEDIYNLGGSVAIGHNRYSTDGDKERHTQPLTDRALGYAFAHNGNLPDTRYLAANLLRRNMHPEHMNDSEMMSYVVSQHIREGLNLPDAVGVAYPYFTGAFSCVAMQDDTVVAFRDSKGIRPLAIGKSATGYSIASETCALDTIGATYEREVMPGEMVIIQGDSLESRMLADGDPKLDIFEFVYFARHDSYLYGKSVNEVRRRFGEELALEHPPMAESDNILVVPVPDTSVPAAEGYAEKLGLRHRQAIIKNRYIGRTFIQPNGKREEELRRKHNMIPEAVAGKDLILIDDSIVRMNTMPRLVEQARQANANSVTVLIASPPIRFPDFYGIDTSDQNELAAFNMTTEEMRKKIGCDYLGFLSLSRLVDATGLPDTDFTLSSFNGEYPISIGDHHKRLMVPASMEYID